ncbi:MAG: hydrogenase maturation nickel metallochaperone HypA [Puniceicoccaceae bacterium]
MHELGIMESAFKLALGELDRHEAKSVSCMVLRIGELAAVDPVALRFAFDAIRPGTALEQAELVIETVQGKAICNKCNEEFTTKSYGILKCPKCGEYTGRLTAGREIDLARLELAE